MQLFYFDRVQRLNKKQPRTIPIISCWTRDMALERIKTENDLNYGYGKILPRIEEKPEDNPKVHKCSFINNEMFNIKEI